MSGTVEVDLPTAFCVAPRSTSLSWGYCKIMFDLLLLLLSSVLMVSLIYTYIFEYMEFHRHLAIGLVIYTIMTTTVIVDIGFHISLVFGVHKKKVNHLKAFCKYTKALWMLTPLIVGIYIIAQINTPYNFDLERYHFQERLNTFIFVMPVAIIFQTFIMLAVISEIKNIEDDNDGIISGSIKIFRTKIKLEIESCSTEKLIETNEAEVETTCSEKEKLPV